MLSCMHIAHRWDSALITARSHPQPPPGDDNDDDDDDDGDDDDDDDGDDDDDIARATSAHMSRPRGRTDKPPPIIRKQKDGCLLYTSPSPQDRG